jgi:hypothetical protein
MGNRQQSDNKSNNHNTHTTPSKNSLNINSKSYSSGKLFSDEKFYKNVESK